MENRDEVKKIVKVMLGMEFNDAAFRRKYFHVKFPMKKMFTRDAIQKAVVDLFETGGNFKAIADSGYDLVIEEVMRQNKCTPKPLASLAPELLETVKKKTKKLLSWHPVKPRTKKRKAPQPLMICYKEPENKPELKPEKQPQNVDKVEEKMMKLVIGKLPELQADEEDEYVDVTDVEDLEIDPMEGYEELSIVSDSGIHEFCLVTDGVPGDVTAEEIRELVHGLRSEDLEVVPVRSPLVREARRVGNQVLLSFDSLLLAELVIDAFGEKMIRGMTVALRRGYSRELEFLAKNFAMPTLILAKLVYVSGLTGDSSEIDQVKAMLEDMKGQNTSSIKSVLVLPGKREMILEFFAVCQADILMYRCRSGILKQLVVCRSNFFMPRVIRCREDGGGGGSSLLAANAANMDASNLQLVCRNLPRVTPRVDRSSVDDEGSDVSYRTKRLAADAAKVKCSSPVENMLDRVPPAQQPDDSRPAADEHPPGFGNNLELSEKAGKRSKFKMEVRLNPETLLKYQEQKPEEEKPEKLSEEKKKLPEKKSELAIVPDPGKRRSSIWQRVLLVKRLRPGYRVDKLRAFFPTSVDAVWHDDYAEIEFESEEAADAVMQSYVDRPQKFCSDEYSLLIYRSKAYVRPGQVNKRNEKVSYERPSRLLVTGIPSYLPDNVVRGGLAELLDRVLKVEPSVTEYGSHLLKGFNRKGELVVLSLYTRAAVRAVVSLQKPLWFNRGKISFSLEEENDDDGGGDHRRRRSLESPRSTKRSRFSSSSPPPSRRRSRFSSSPPPQQSLTRKHSRYSPPPARKWWKEKIEQRKLVVYKSEVDCHELEEFLRGLLPREDDMCVVEMVYKGLVTVVLGSEAAADRIMDRYVIDPHSFLLRGAGLCIYRDRYYLRDRVSGKEIGSSEEKPEEVLVRGFPPLHENILAGTLCELLSRAFSGKGKRISRQGVDLVKRFTSSLSGTLVVNLCNRHAAEAAMALEKPLKLDGSVLEFSFPAEDCHEAPEARSFQRKRERDEESEPDESEAKRRSSDQGDIDKSSGACDDDCQRRSDGSDEKRERRDQPRELDDDHQDNEEQQKLVVVPAKQWKLKPVDRVEQRKLVVTGAELMDLAELERFIRGLLPTGDDWCRAERAKNVITLLLLGSEAAADRVMEAYTSYPETFTGLGSGVSLYRDRNYSRPGNVRRNRGGSSGEKSDEILVKNLPVISPKVLSGVVCELLCRALSGSPVVCREGVDFLLRKLIPVEGREREFLATLYSREVVWEVLALEKPVEIAGKVIRFSLPGKKKQEVDDDQRRSKFPYFDARSNSRGEIHQDDRREEFADHHRRREHQRSYQDWGDERSPREFEELDRRGSSSKVEEYYRGSSLVETPGRGVIYSGEKTPSMENSSWTSGSSSRHGEFQEGSVVPGQPASSSII